MPFAFRHEHGDTYRLDLSGRLLNADAARCEAELSQALSAAGSIRLLCVLERFDGWDAGGGSMNFYVKHGDAITRIAIVGDERWRGEAMMFALADLRRAPVKFFSAAELPQARHWLSGAADGVAGTPHSKG
jgi:hypothetical protein